MYTVLNKSVLYKFKVNNSYTRILIYPNLTLEFNRFEIIPGFLFTPI